jgi:phosphosulfolactate synthase
MNKTALVLPERAVKPRHRGITMVIDGGLPLRSLADLVESAGEFVDFVKLGWGTAIVSAQLPAKLDLLRQNGIDYYFGGTLFEKHVVQGRFDDFRDFCEHWRCRFVEVSNGTICLSNQQKCGHIEKLRNDFDVISEVGFKDPTRSERFAPMSWFEAISEDLDAGAQLVTLESRESGRSGICRPDGELRVELVEGLVSGMVDVDRLLFEAPSTGLQAHMISRVGPNVNLGNIPVTGVLGLETLRLGLRADTLTLFEPPER